MKPKICNFKIDVPCGASTKFHHISQNATFATQCALCNQFAQPCQCHSQDTRNTTAEVVRLQKNIEMNTSKVPYLFATKGARYILKTTEKYCAGHAKGISIRHQTRPHVTKSYTCHQERSHVTRPTSKTDLSRKIVYQHGHMAIVQAVADGCERFDNIKRTHLDPQTPKVKRKPLLRIRDKSHQNDYRSSFKSHTFPSKKPDYFFQGGASLQNGKQPSEHAAFFSWKCGFLPVIVKQNLPSSMHYALRKFRFLHNMQRVIDIFVLLRKKV